MRKTQNLAAALVIIAILSALGAYLLAHQKAAELHGPVHIRAFDHDIVVVDGRNLSWLESQTGRLLRQRSLAEMGLSVPLMDIQLLPDGTLLAAETETKHIRRCPPGNAPCDTLTDLSWLAGRFFKFAFDPAAERLFVAGTHDNRLWELHPPYTEPQMRVFCSQLASPNEIWLSPEGTLWVADTDHRRVVELRDAEPVAEETGRVLQGHRRLLEKSFPLDFTGRQTGPWWVLLSGPTYLNGVVVEYGRDLAPGREIALPPGADPIAVEPLGEAALIADMEGFALYRIAEGTDATRFGDAAFYRSLDNLKDEANYYKTLQYVGLGLLLLGILGAVFVAIWSARTNIVQRPKPTKSPAATPKHEPSPPDLEPEQGIYWLEPSPRLIRLTKRLALALMALSPIALVLVYLSGLWFFDIGYASIAIALVGLVVGFLMWANTDYLFPCLGTDGRIVYIRGRDHRIYPYSPRNGLISPRGLLIERRWVAFLNGLGQPVFDPRHVDRYIRPLFDANRTLGEWQIFVQALRVGHPGTWIVVILCIVMILWLLYRGVF